MLSRVILNQNRHLIRSLTSQFRFCSSVNNDIIVNTPLSKPLTGKKNEFNCDK